MEEFDTKFNDLINRGYEISFYEDENYNLFTQKPETVYYVLIKKNGNDLFRFPSRTSSERAFLDGCTFMPTIEKLLNKKNKLYMLIFRRLLC
jgi:hypothetical protein